MAGEENRVFEKDELGFGVRCNCSCFDVFTGRWGCRITLGKDYGHKQVCTAVGSPRIGNTGEIGTLTDTPDRWCRTCLMGIEVPEIVVSGSAMTLAFISR
jgi:hypothetical protein